jgi:hypothetical protein
VTTARAIPLLLAALALGGCGGDSDERLSKTEYEGKVHSVYAEVQAAFAATNVEPEQLAARVEDAQEELRSAADELESVQPPEDLDVEHAQIAEGMRAYADDLDVLREAAERADQAAIDAFNSRVGENRSVKLIAEAAEKAKFKGYDLGPIAEE